MPKTTKPETPENLPEEAPEVVTFETEGTFSIGESIEVTTTDFAAETPDWTPVEPEPTTEDVVVTSLPVFRRLSLDNPPAEMAHLQRSTQKELITRANALQQQGIGVDEAIRQVMRGF